MSSEAFVIAGVLILAYLLGSIPTAYIVGRIRKGFDIRQVGSKNMGAMNTFYNVGMLPGFLVVFTDIGKGAAAVALAQWLVGLTALADGEMNKVIFLAGALAIIGHAFPVWLKFHGGKGGATLIGVFIYLMPWGIPIGLGIFGLLLLLTKFPTLSYGVALLVFPIIAWAIYHRTDYAIYTLIMLLVVLLKYTPRVVEMYKKAGGWGHFFKRKGLKDRL